MAQKILGSKQLRRVMKTGERPVYQRVLSVLRATGRRVVTISPGSLVCEVRERFPDYPRPLIGEVFDAVIYWQQTGQLQRLGCDDLDSLKLRIF